MISTSLVRRLAIVLLLAAPLLMAPVGIGEDDARSREELLKLGDTYLKEKTYKRALEAYQRFLARFPEDPERFAVHEKVGRAMLGLRNRHGAIQMLRAVRPKAPAGSLERARLAGLLGAAMASYHGGSKECVSHLDEALAIYRKLAADRPDIRRTLLDTLFVLAQALSYSWDYEIRFDTWREANPDVPKEKADETWQKYQQAEQRRQDDERRKRVEATHAEILEIDGGKGHDAARSRFLLGCFRINAAGRFRGNADYYTPMPGEKDVPDEVRDALNDYVAWVEKGIAAWTELATANSEDELADDAMFLVAHTIHHRLNDFPRAVKAYEAFLETHAGSRWASDARKHLQDIRKEDIVLAVPGILPPGTQPEIGLTARNVRTLKMTAYRLDLPALLRKNRDLRVGEIDKLNLDDLTPHHRWTVETGAGGDHSGIQKLVRIPVDATGAYLLVAEGERRTARALLVLSRLTLIQKLAGNRHLYLVVDTATGEPKAGANVTLLARTRKGPLMVPKLVEGKTDDEGFFEPDMTKLHEYASGWQSTAVGWVRDDVAVTHGWFDYRRPGETHRVYTFTDRPVYRPDQTVHFKITVRRGKEGDWVNAPGKPVTVRITDPRNGKLYERTLVANAHGSVSGDLALGAEPPLGLYRIRVWVDGRQVYTYGYVGATFRVEEYKKPEYEVKVNASADRVAPGETVEAAVEARYYFGAPVANADVTFRVHRVPYRHVILPTIRYAWYHDLERTFGRRSWDWQRELILQGQGKTDEDGRLALSFPAKEFDDGRDSKYLIEASVVDQSRREIRGAGQVFATKTPFFVFLEPERRIYRPGDRAKVKIRARTANDKPVKSEGELVVSIRRDGEPDEDGKPTVTWEEIGRVPASTDATGEGRGEFVPDRLGAYRFEYVTKGEKDVEVRGATTLWIVSEDFQGAAYRFQNVQLVADQRTYRIGDTLRLLVNTQFPDVPVLLTREADGRLLDRRLVRTTGKSAVLEIPVTAGWVPNVFVKALFVRDGKVYQDRLEIVVPPEDRFLDVTLVGPKPSYLPGEEATFTVQVEDASGEPVATETAVTFYDKSITYIQPELAPDLRKFFYGNKRRDRVRLNTSFDWKYLGRDVLKSGLTWVEYRTNRLPDPVHPWRYNYASANRGVWEVERLSRGNKRADGGAAQGFGGAPPAPASAAPARGGRARRSLELGEEADAEASGDDFAAKDKKAESRSGGGGKEPRLRSFFADSAYWNAHLVTGADGKGEVKVTFPDSLTTWSAIVRAISDDTKVGAATAEPVVKKNVLVRLAAPRFFTERDEVVLSGLVRNDLKETKAVRITLELEGGTLELLPKGELSVPEQTIRIAPGKEQRVDWRCRVVRPGEAMVTVSAITDVESDAMRRTFPVLPHAVEKFEGRSGSFVLAGGLHEGEGTQTVSFELPEKLDPRGSRLEVVVAPSLASMLLEPLPYLADYPYGCTEQTLNRFVPSVVVKKTLADLGIDIDTLKVPEVRDVPGGFWGTPRAQKLKALKKEDLDAIVKAGLTRLYDFQHGDGGWGWWKQGASDDFMTALVLRGLILARDAGVKVDEKRLERAAGFLLGMVEKLNLEERAEIGDRIEADAYAHLAEALLRYGKLDAGSRESVRRLIDALFDLRDRLAAGGRAFLALSLHHLGDAERAGILLENLTDHALVDEAKGTARFGRTSGYRTWRDDAVEATAWTLQAYLAAKPTSPLVPRMMRWLTRNRRGAHWASTRDTASAILGLSAYLKRTRELDADVTVTVTVDGGFSRQIRFTRDNALTGDDRVVLKGEQLRPGKHEITVAKSGKGNVYFSAYATYITREDDIKGAGHEIHVERRFHRLVPKEVEEERNVWVGNHWEKRKVTVLRHERVPLESGASLESGDLIEVEMLVRSDNDYRYLVFEDYKAAGCEPVRLRSGTSFGGLWTNMELRDEKVAFFASRLPQTGPKEAHTIRYRLRCEVPGTFSAMPVRAWAMYLPEVRAISDEFKLTIGDKIEK
jgi:uncharacterized protein YfaS (alpha-2-macroglobulin family)/tetratricopeptide (TPR) repeat protein